MAGSASSKAGRSGKVHLHPVKLVVFTLLSTLLFLVVLEAALWSMAQLIRWQNNADAPETGDGGLLLIGFGDSVTAGFSLPKDASYVWQLNNFLHEHKHEQVRVINRAAFGARSHTVLVQQLESLEAHRHDQRVICLVMIGHNDFVNEHNLVLPIADRPASLTMPSSDPARRDERTPFRTERVLHWARIAMGLQTTKLEILPTSRSAYLANIQSIQSRIQRAGGTMYLLTYLIPGEPASDLDAGLARLIRQVRPYQAEVNWLIREAARTHGIELIDLEVLLPMPDTWSREDFIDHIHLTAATQERLARVILTQLLRRGALRSAQASQPE